jgi:hypothetical protein
MAQPDAWKPLGDGTMHASGVSLAEVVRALLASGSCSPLRASHVPCTGGRRHSHFDDFWSRRRTRRFPFGRMLETLRPPLAQVGAAFIQPVSGTSISARLNLRAAPGSSQPGKPCGRAFFRGSRSSCFSRLPTRTTFSFARHETSGPSISSEEPQHAAPREGVMEKNRRPPIRKALVLTEGVACEISLAASGPAGLPMRAFLTRR